MGNIFSKIGIIGDMHMKDNLSYSDYVKDQRIPEKKAILDFIVTSFADCHSVIFMGDNLNSRNNSSEVIKEFVEFVERFPHKQVYVIAGNHEKKGNGKSAIDFMREINKPNWHIITTPTAEIVEGDTVYFLPYMSRSELGVATNEEGRDKLLRAMSPSRFLFAHHAISDTFSNAGVSTNTFNEIILPKTQLENVFDVVVAGHIHKPQVSGKTVITGSVFSNEAGEIEKFIWKLDTQTNSVEKLKVPGRGIYKFENPSIDALSVLPLDAIIKAVVTSKEVRMDELKECLRRFDAHMILEQYPNERKKLHFDEGAIDFSIANLLRMYATEKKIDYEKLIKGFELIADK